MRKAEFRLRHRERGAYLARRHPRQERGLLLRRAVPADQVGDDEVRVDDAGDGHPAPGDLLRHQGVREQGLAEAAVLLVDGQAEDAEFPQPRDDLARVGVGAVEFGRRRSVSRAEKFAMLIACPTHPRSRLTPLPLTTVAPVYINSTDRKSVVEGKSV